MKDYDLKVSATPQRTCVTGGVRDSNDGKGRPELASPLAEHRLWVLLQKGAAKRGDRNWEQGLPLSWYVESLKRHVRAYQEGDRSEDHPAAMQFNSMALTHTEEMIERGLLPKELDDLPRYNGVPNRVDSAEAAGLFSPLTHFETPDEMPLWTSQGLTPEPMTARATPPLGKLYRPRIYVSGPFSGSDAERTMNVAISKAACLLLAEKGWMPFSPHESSNFLHGKLGYEDFMEFDLDLLGARDKHGLRFFDALFYICDSPGALREREAACEEEGMAVYYTLDEVPDYSGNFP